MHWQAAANRAGVLCSRKRPHCLAVWDVGDEPTLDMAIGNLVK